MPSRPQGGNTAVFPQHGTGARADADAADHPRVTTVVNHGTSLRSEKMKAVRCEPQLLPYLRQVRKVDR